MLLKCKLSIDCDAYATKCIMFTSGMTGDYCEKHAAIFDAGMIEEIETIDYRHTEEYRQFVDDTVDDEHYNAYLEHIHTPNVLDY